jgi:hypothetical protein
MRKTDEKPLPCTVSFKPRSMREYIETEEGRVRAWVMINSLVEERARLRRSKK